MKIFIFVSFLYLNALFHSTSSQTTLLQVIFRQAERFPDRDERQLAGSDQYDSFFANFTNYGEHKGKLRQYNLGKMLRQMNSSWLGDYNSSEVYARSTSIERSKVSLLAMLSGLYPVTPNASFTDEINWSPIPTVYNPIDRDFLLVTMNPACGVRQLGLGNMTLDRQKMEPYRSFYNELRSKTNITAFQPILFSRIYNYVESTLARGLALPNWCTQDDYQKLRETTAIHYESLRDPAGKKAIAGPIIDQFLINIRENQEKRMKLYAYSAHAVNIASLVQAHDAVNLPSIPEYGSAIFVETLLKGNQTYIKMNYWTGTTGQLLPIKPIKLPNCEAECLLDTYVQIMNPVIPNQQEKACYSS